MAGPPSYDEDLLSRLNALRKSNVTLVDTGPTVPKIEATPESDLASRLKSLRNSGGSNYGTAARNSGSGLKPSRFAHPPPAAVFDPKSFHLGSQDEIHTALNDIDVISAKSWRPNDEKVTKDLLAGAKKALSEKKLRDRDNPTSVGSSSDPKSAAGDPATPASTDDEDDGEDGEILARIMDEVDLENNDETGSKSEPAPEPVPQPNIDPRPTPQHTTVPPEMQDPTFVDGALQLPGVPSVDPKSAEGPPEDDPETLDFAAKIAARMAALKNGGGEVDLLGLPAAPTGAPGRKQSLPPRKPESLVTWCAICTDNATRLCHGCDEQLYCTRCWKEVHLGPDVEWEERSHEWEKFKPPT